MTLDQIIEMNVGRTTIDPIALRAFVKTVPNYYGWGIDRSANELDLDQLNSADFFEFHLKRYLIGHPKTLYAVFDVVRQFVNEDANAAHHFIKYSIAVTRQTLLRNEWYELISRLEAAEPRILELAPEIDYLLRPLLVSFLEESMQQLPGEF